MRNQKGEVVTGVMVVMMVGLMIFGGMTWMHGRHGDHKEHTKSDQQTHSETGQKHMHHGEAENAHQPDVEERK